MQLSKKIKWICIWISFTILKKAFSSQIHAAKDKDWLQKPKNKVSIYNRVDFILDQCTNKNILHIGFADHPFTKNKITNTSLLHLFLRQTAAKAVGVDDNKNSISDYIRLTGDKNVYYCDIMKSYPTEILTDEFDIILLSEVLEHLKQPATALDILHENFKNGTIILVTVPNYAAIASLAYSLNKAESIHPDHYWYFSPYTLFRLFNKEKFELKELHFGMYYQRNKKLNRVIKKFPFNGDCIIAIFSIKK